MHPSTSLQLINDELMQLENTRKCMADEQFHLSCCGYCGCCYCFVSLMLLFQLLILPFVPILLVCVNTAGLHPYQRFCCCCFVVVYQYQRLCQHYRYPYYRFGCCCCFVCFVVVVVLVKNTTGLCQYYRFFVVGVVALFYCCFGY